MSVQDLVEMDDEEIDLATESGDESGDDGDLTMGMAETKNKEKRNTLERDRRARNKVGFQELREVLPNDGGRHLSNNAVLEATVEILVRFNEAKEKYSFKFTVADACSKIEEEKERMLNLIEKAKAKNIDLDEVPGFDHFVETYNFDEGTMSYVKPGQADVPKQRLKLRTRPRAGLRRKKPYSK